jgi:hypothetical protein
MSTPTDEQKWFISILSAIIFYVIASPTLYKITGSIFYDFFGVKIVDRKGRPNNLGLLIHTIVFALISRGVMDIKELNKLIETKK